MHIRKAWAGIGVFLFAALLYGTYSIFAEAEKAPESFDSYRQLLQKGLTLHELDRELSRIAEEEKQIAERIRVTENQIEEEQELYEEQKVKTGKLLRAYYTGERRNLLFALLRMDDLSEALTVIQYLQIIFQNDKKMMQDYLASANRLKENVRQLHSAENELKEIESLFLKQREQLTAMQQEFDEELEQQPDAEQVMQHMNLLIEDWEQNGIPLFRSYFTALSEAMQKLPEMISENDGYLTVNGFKWTFELTDKQLNSFLRQQNKLFEKLTFTFEEGKIIVEGVENDKTLLAAGRYELKNDPVNHIDFRIDRLAYNGFELPEPTINEMDDAFELGFYPKNILSFVEATQVEMNEGQLRVHLAFSVQEESD